MSKFTFEKNFSLKSFLLVGSIFSIPLLGQNAKQVADIRKATELRKVSELKTVIQKTKPSTEKLQTLAKQLQIPFRGEFNDKIYQLVDVDSKGLPQYYITNNSGAAAGTQTNKLYNSYGVFNLSGQGITLHEWDGGLVRTTHTEFQGRVLQKDSLSAISSHATHVAGTMVAGGVSNPALRGMAYAARLNAYDWTNDASEMTTAVGEGALVSNHSYGFANGFEWGNFSGTQGWHWMGDDDDVEFKGYGKYSSTDVQWDFISASSPFYLPVKAAGNPRGNGPAPGGTHFVQVRKNGALVWVTSNKVRQVNGGADGFDTVDRGGIGKNIMVVAAAEKIPGDYSGPQDVKLAGFSAFGPTDDGRIKPDITGIGVDLLSANSTSNTATAVLSGTSMASPNVSGSLGLLQQHYRDLNDGAFMKGSTLKGLAIHTAFEAGDAPGPDYKHGWGLLNSFKAAQTISLNKKYALIQENTLDNSQENVIDLVASGTEPLVATIVWDDPSPVVLPNATVLDDPTPVLVNDLDAKIVLGSDEFLPWILDPANPGSPATKGNNVRDNVEQIFIENPVGGSTYQLKISHKGRLKKNNIQNDNIIIVDADNQSYSLIVTGVKGDIAKDIELFSIKPTVASKDYSASTPVEIKYKNKGNNDIAAAVINVKLNNKDTGALISQQDIEVPAIAVGASGTLSYNVDLSIPFVNYELTVESILEGDEVVVNNKQVLTLRSTIIDLTSPDSKYNYGFEANFTDHGWISEDVDGNGLTWRKYDDASFARTGSSFAINFPNLKNGINDWLISNSIKLSADAKYLVSFSTRKLRTGEEPLQLFWGNDGNSAAMTTQISPVISASGQYVKYIYEISPQKTGIYHFGFQQRTDETAEESYAVFIDDFSIQHSAAKPTADFRADKTTPNTFEKVLFANETVTQNTPPANYQWTFTPSTVEYLDGTSSTSKNPAIRFASEGTYAVKLEATNAQGTDVLDRKNYIVAKNTAVVAKFNASKTSILANDIVNFTNASTGNPLPATWEWTVVPNEGFTFINETTATSQNISLQFQKLGNYIVSLKATAPHGTNTATEKIEVDTYYRNVRSVAASINDETKDVKLSWERPALRPSFIESFENGGVLPAGYTSLDENADGNKWFAFRGSAIPARTGSYSVVSTSYKNNKAFDAKDWLVTEKMTKGLETLSFFTKTPYLERFEVYVVPAPASGAVPTLEEVKAGTRIMDVVTEGSTSFVERTADLKGKTETDFHIAFLHNTTAKDNGFYLAIDDVSVGYDNGISAATTNSKPEINPNNSNAEDLKSIMMKGEYLVEDIWENAKAEAKTIASSSGESQTLAATTFPRLTGYEVYKDGALMEAISDPATRTATENLSNQKGPRTYDVVALYSDGKSEKESVTINFDFTSLSTAELALDKLSVYPNPTNGPVTIKANNAVKGLSVNVFDLSGKQIINKKSNISQLDFDLSSYPKGVYIINVIDHDGNKKAVKIIKN